MVELFVVVGCRLDTQDPEKLERSVQEGLGEDGQQGIVLLPNRGYRLDSWEHPENILFDGIHSVFVNPLNDLVSYCTGLSWPKTRMTIFEDNTIFSIKGFKSEGGIRVPHLAYLIRVSGSNSFPSNNPNGKIIKLA